MWGRLRTPAIALFLGALALLLGYSGYRALPGDASVSDTLFQALQLFALEGNVPPDGTPWQLEIARFLAPATLAYLAILAVLSVAREGAERLQVRATAKNHVVVVGLGALGSAIASSLVRSRHVVGIEADSSAPRLAGLRRKGVRIITGDATQQEVLAAARIERASDIVVVPGTDTKALEVLAVCRPLLGETSVASLHVVIGDTRLWKELDRASFSAQRAQGWIEFVHLPDRAARLVAERARMDDAIPAPSVVIQGDGDTAIRLATHLVRASAETQASIQLRLSPDAGVRLRSLEPWCFESAEVITEAPADGANATVGFVCDESDDAAAISAASQLVRDVEGSVYVATFNDHDPAAFAAIADVRLIAARTQAIGDELLQPTGIELLARAKHADYVRSESARGVQPESKPSMHSWEELSEDMRESNRAFARSIAEKLEALDVHLRPLTGRMPEHELDLPGNALEEMAEAEHDRWMQAQIDRGWTATTGERDDETKKHPMLVPWSELPESEREKDRDPIRALPRLLGHVGYEIVLPESPTASDA